MSYTKMEKIGINIGTGVCNVLNKIRDVSDRYDDYYSSKKEKGVMDHIVNAASSLGKGGVAMVKGIKKGINTITKSETMQMIKEDTIELYKDIRTSYKTFLQDNQNKIDAQLKQGRDNIGVEFKFFFNSILQTVDNIYSKGENAVKNMAASLSTQKEGVKASSAYQKLIATRDAVDAKQAEKETDYGPSKM